MLRPLDNGSEEASNGNPAIIITSSDVNSKITARRNYVRQTSLIKIQVLREIVNNKRPFLTQQLEVFFKSLEETLKKKHTIAFPANIKRVILGSSVRSAYLGQVSTRRKQKDYRNSGLSKYSNGRNRTKEQELLDTIIK